MTTSLPPNPSVENLKKQAKTLLKSWRSGNAETIARVRAAHPRYAGAPDEQIRSSPPHLADCQLILAREAGFNSWPELKVAVGLAAKELAEEFITLGCLCYEDPHYDQRSFQARANEMLQNNPALAEVDIWSAATAGNAAAVRRFLDETPDLVNRPGVHGWPPLICACYSRVKPIDPAHSTFEAAKVLLDRGAGPNTSTMREYYEMLRFSALAGLFGGGDTGMANQPPHPRWHELAVLLLDRGADPADATAVSIMQGEVTSQKLELLLRYGLKPDAQAPHKNADPRTGTITIMGLALARAVCIRDLPAVRLMLAHNARTDELYEGKTPWQHAMERGNVEIAGLLEKAGAPVAETTEVERFVTLCLAGDEPGVRQMLEHAPDLAERAPKDMVHRAVGTRRKEAVHLALDLGFDPNRVEDNAAIHQSDVLAEYPEILEMLLTRGASLTLREPWYDGTAIGWADFGDQRELRDRLLNERVICLFDALDYDRLDRVPDILARDAEALNRPFARCLARDPKPEDWKTPLVRMVEKGKTDGVRVLLKHGADITAKHPDGRSLVQLARDNGFGDIVALLDHHRTTG